jgi:hypothetical protein
MQGSRHTYNYSSEPGPLPDGLSSSSPPASSSDCEDGISSNKGGREVGSIVLKFRSALTSLVYFSDLSALVSVTIADIFCMILSVKIGTELSDKVYHVKTFLTIYFSEKISFLGNDIMITLN